MAVAKVHKIDASTPASSSVVGAEVIQVIEVGGWSERDFPSTFPLAPDEFIEKTMVDWPLSLCSFKRAADRVSADPPVPSAPSPSPTKNRRKKRKTDSDSS
jgi:hypothetical protein